jgi:cell division protein FtsB
MRSKANKQISKWQNLLYSKIFLLTGIVIVIIMILVLVRDFIHSYDIKKEIQDKQNEISILEDKNQELTDMIEYLKSQDYVETQAKKKLGLHKIGETKIVISDNEVEKLLNKSFKNDKADNIQEKKEIDFLEKTPNYKLWWNYFFN